MFIIGTYKGRKASTVTTWISVRVLRRVSHIGIGIREYYDCILHRHFLGHVLGVQVVWEKKGP